MSAVQNMWFLLLRQETCCASVSKPIDDASDRAASVNAELNEILQINDLC